MSETMDLTNQSHMRNLAEATQALQDMVKQKHKSAITDSEYKEKFEKIDVDLAKADKANNELVAKLVQAETREKSMAEKMEALEKNFYRQTQNQSTGFVEKSEAVKFFEEFVKKGQPFLNAANNHELAKKYLRTDNNVDGGFLLPFEITGPIIKPEVEISPIRSIARVTPTANKEIVRVARTGAPTSRWLGEAETATETQSKYGRITIPVHAQRVFTDITREQLADSMFNMETEIMFDTAQAFAKAEGDAFINGDGVSQPLGLLNAPGVDAFDSGAALTPEAIISLTGQLKDAYNPVFVFNRRTLSTIRQFVGANGQFIWEVFKSTDPMTILGERYVIANDMPDIPGAADPAGAKTPIIYGDFVRAYEIADRMSIEFLRDDYSKSTNAEVRFHFFRRVGGGVIQTEAFKKLTVTKQ